MTNISRLSLAAIVALTSASALATDHTINQVNLTFVPSSLTVAPGDTVRWVRTSGSHSVTSGANCTPSGLFNAPLTSTNTSFTWTVPASLAGTNVPYYCIPHCGGGQVGILTVINPAPSPDIDNNGKVDGGDLGAILANWGASGSTDLDGDGVTGGADLGILLSAWTG
jgi:plastocyanin